MSWNEKHCLIIKHILPVERTIVSFARPSRTITPPVLRLRPLE